MIYDWITRIVPELYFVLSVVPQMHLLFKKDIYTLHVFNTLSSTVPFNKTMAINRTWDSVESIGV